MAQTTILIQKKVILFLHLSKNLLIQKIVKKFVEIWGSGLPKREIMHVDDLADAISFIIYKKLENNKSLINLIKKK